MPSQEDYLDNLLKDMGQENTTAETSESSVFTDIEDFVSVENLGEPDAINDSDAVHDADVINDADILSDADVAKLAEELMDAGILESLNISVMEDTDSENILDDFKMEESFPTNEETENAVSDEQAILAELLAGFSEEMSASETPNVEENAATYLDDVEGMTQDEIENLLALSTEHENAEGIDFEAIPEELLFDKDDIDLQDIQDLLEKSDNNILIDEGTAAFTPDSEEIGPADELLADIEGQESAENILDKKQLRAQEKERKRAEKAEKKAAKKADREMAKAEKAAARAVKESTKKAVKAEKTLDETVELDTAFLDSIVSGAGMVGNDSLEENIIGNDLASDDSFAAEDFFAAMGGDTDADSVVDSVADVGDVFGEGMGDISVSDIAEFDMDAIAMLTGVQSTDEVELNEIPEKDAGKQKGKKQKEKKAKTAKTAKTDSAGDITKEKTGLFSRIVNFLLEEDEEEEGNENIHLSDENQGILDELDKKGKKGKKGKKAKGKKADVKADKEETDDKKERAEKKPPKPKREKKPKKEKPVDLETVLQTGPKLTFKKILPVLLLGITIGAVIFILSGVSTDTADKRAAKQAFLEEDYETCYQNLFGKELNDSEAIMYGTSESILYIRLWYSEYLMYAEAGQELEALDSLIQTVNDYPLLYEYASLWNATGQIQEVYAEILKILSSKYGLSEMQAIEIADIRRDDDYTRAVMAVLNGQHQSSPDDSQGAAQEGGLQDELPEESGMGQGGFVDNWEK